MIVEVWRVFSEEKLECLFAQTARSLPEATIQVPGFGSSDCRCASHLVHIPYRPSLPAFNTRLKHIGIDTITLARLSVPGVHENHRKQ